MAKTICDEEIFPKEMQSSFSKFCNSIAGLIDCIDDLHKLGFDTSDIINDLSNRTKQNFLIDREHVKVDQIVKKLSSSPYSEENSRFSASISQSTLSQLSGIRIPRHNKLIARNISHMKDELERIKSECDDFIQELQSQEGMLETLRQQIDSHRRQ